MRFFYNVLMIVSLFSLGIGCKTTSPSTTSLENQNIENESYVVTYMINVEKKKDDIGNAYYECTLDNQVKTRGYLKQRIGFSHSDENHDQLLFVFKDKNGQTIHETKEHNPLVKHFDVPHEDGKLEKKTVYVDEEVIGIRVNYRPDISTLQVFLLEENQKIEISTIQLTKQ